MIRKSVVVLVVSAGVVVGCKNESAGGAGGGASAGAGAGASASASASASAGASAAPSSTASLDGGGDASTDAGVDAAIEAPVVKLENIGMHLGGTSNTPAMKEPIAKSVEPSFPAFKRCWLLVDDKKRGGDFGIDLLIESDGGKAKVSNPRTALKGAGFEACMMQVFSNVDFQKTRTGKTMASYSLRFTP